MLHATLSTEERMHMERPKKKLVSNTSCHFEEEESLLQSKGRKMGVLIYRTPKCHVCMYEIGIYLYSWGCAKSA